MSDTPYLVFTTRHPRTNEAAFAEFERAEALALAQLLKRISFNDCRANAVDDDEAYLMIDALGKIGKLLADAGIAPR